MLQDLNIHERFKTSCVSLEDAREVLRQHRRLKDIMEKREDLDSPRGS